MLAAAKERSQGFTNIEYQRCDAAELDLPDNSYDCIASIAAFHHLPLETLLPSIRRALKPGGFLLVVDIYQPDTWMDALRNLISFPIHVSMRLVKIGRLIDPMAMRMTWMLHSANDRYLSIPQARAIYLPHLPGRANPQAAVLALYGDLAKTL